MLSNYQLKIADLYNIPIENVQELVPSNSIKKNMCLKFHLRLGLKLKKYITYYNSVNHND